jgi:hypothetical protein
MPTIHFLGKVVPSNYYSTTMWGLPKVHFKAGDGSFEADVLVNVKGSEIDVECTMVTYKKEDHLAHVHKIAYDLARAAINVMVFATGATQLVVFDRLIDENGTLSPFIIQHPDLKNLCTAYALEANATTQGVGDILQIIMTEPSLFLAMDDLITSTTIHHLVVVNAARSIEGLRHAMASPGMSREQEWTNFRNNLNLDRKYVSLIIDHSKSGRHGDGIFIPGSITEVIAVRSWTIMNRFLEFRKRGSVPLPLIEFPLLAG